ncbi:MAG: RNA polymerase sigma-70 factor [Oligoflexus sp.]|nr:RNA polymerase sigma-70 factor [Pseudopedobacter sp.]
MLDKNLIDIDFNDDIDESFFKTIYVDFYPGLIVFANGYLKDIAMAEDTVEDVFVKLWINKYTISAIKNLKLYLFISVKNACINQLVKQKRINIQLLDDFEIDIKDITATAEENMISDERIALINTELNKLPKKCRAIFILVKEEELKYREVATLLNLSIKTIEAQMSIAFKKLALAFQDEFPAYFVKASRKKSV